MGLLEIVFILLTALLIVALMEVVFNLIFKKSFITEFIKMSKAITYSVVTK